MQSKLKSFAENVYVNLVSGLVLLTTAGYEIVRTLEEGEIGAHHGVALFAVLQTIKVLPHFVHGAEQVSKLQD